MSILMGFMVVGCTKSPKTMPIENPANTPSPTIEVIENNGDAESEPNEIATPMRMTQEEINNYLSTFKWTPNTKELLDADKYLTYLSLSHLLYTDETLYVPTIDNELHKVRALPELKVIDNTYYLSINLVGSKPVSQIHFSKISEGVSLNITSFKNPINVLLFYNENLIANCVN